MKFFRIVVFLFFSAALFASADCLLDVSRVDEHHGAFLSAFVCIVACSLAVVDLDI